VTGEERKEADGVADEPRCDPTYGLPPVLTVEDAAAFLRMNSKTVYAAVAAGEMPGRKVRKRTVILRDALLDWLRTGQGRVSRSRRLR